LISQETTASNSAEADRVREVLREIGPVLVAFSGGVDSTVLLKFAVDELGPDRVVAVTAHGDVHTPEELARARRLADEIGVRHMVIDSHELEVPGFSENPPDRCFMCRGAMYQQMWELARIEGFGTVVDGANRDDGSDYRPGMRAAKSLAVRSPLAEAGLGKAEVRALARESGLSNWDLPASPCLSSRFPYGEEITKDKLLMVAAGERRLRELGFATARVRHHGDLARIEVDAPEIPRAAQEVTREAIVGYLREIGYNYVTLDLEGFRSGSMNETLTAKKSPEPAPEEEA
jgi:pyridinium-3,5-biscarboxylic acid mononucleotide sulfurtransferase